MLKHIFSFTTVFTLVSSTLWAQLPYGGHKPVAKTQAEYQLSVERSKQQNHFKTDAVTVFPAGMRLPGEFEESQAVAISWAFEYDNNFNIIGVDTSSEYGLISAQICDAVQPECTIWIRINAAGDSTAIKKFMQNRGKALYNYKFMVAAGDDWWTRDFGPMAFYYGASDNIGFTDMKYYDGRDNDNIFPAQLAQKMGYPNFVTKLNSEGGNLMTDGFGRLFMSTVVKEVNADNTIHLPGWTTTQTYDTLRSVFATPVLYDLQKLVCDGGTGHIDLYIKLIDEQTLLIAQYPSVITAIDKKTIEDNVQLMSTKLSTYGRPFRVIRVEHPTNDNGSHTRLNCSQIDADARNFINGLTVNKTFIFPSYSDGVTGNIAQHNRIMSFLQQNMPGYKIVPIDSRAISPLGGAIHCITMQIPAENPVVFWHPSVDGVQPALAKYHIIAKISNKSGINKAVCRYRKNGGTWQQIVLTDSAGYKTGDIVSGGMSATDYIDYYLTALTNNGKTAVKPITAPDGFYTIRTTAVTSAEKISETEYLFGAYPNPANATVTIPFKIAGSNIAVISVYDITGKLMFEKEITRLNQGLNEQTVDVSNWSKGMYFYSLTLNGIPTGTRKLVVQ